jgi:hypothetical protein
MKKSFLLTNLFVLLLLVNVSAQSSCPAITGLRVSNITSTNATFDWDAGPFDGYNIEYKASYSTTWVWFGGGSFPHQEMSVFSPGTTYEVRVRGSFYFGDCPPSAFITFTTLGSVPPPVSYCTSKGLSTSYGWIKSVKLGTINNVSGNNSGYANFTSLSTGIPGNTIIPLTVQAGAKKTPQSQKWALYIDLNNDGDFFDAGETVANFVSVAGEIVTQNIVIPTTLTGNRRMRISMQYMFVAGGGPCGTFQYGEVEDYTINVTAAVAARTITDASEVVLQKAIPNNQAIVYPNPTKDVLNVVYSKEPVNELKVFDFTGRIRVKQNGFTGSKVLDISGLSSGAYVLILTTKSGDIKQTFIKQ